jgi:menaquinone-specific isochorismate synthase
MIHSALLTESKAPRALHVMRVPVNASSPWRLPPLLLGVELFGWVDEDGTTWVGVGRSARWQGAPGPELLETAQEALKNSGSEAQGLRAFFCHAFDPAHPTDPLGALVAPGHVTVPRWLLCWSPRALRGEASVSAWVVAGESGTPESLQASADGLLDWLAQPEAVVKETPLQRVPDAEVQAGFEQAVQQALDLIDRGVLEKVVLARPCYLESAAHVASWSVFQRVVKKGSGTLRFHFRDADGATFLGASPECLVALDGPHVRVDVLAGTTPRGVTPAADAQQAEQLKQSTKDRHEHGLVRSAVLASLAPLVESVVAPEAPGLLPLTHVWHLQTPVSGVLRPGVSWGALVRALHPTPAVGGTPREAALRVIAQLEPTGRGYYAGPVGWLSADQAAAAVGIRSAHVRGNRAVALAGAGIVKGSNPRAEWEETQRKLRPMLQALLGNAEGAEARP